MIEVILADKILGIAFIHASRLEPVIAKHPPKGKMSNVVEVHKVRLTKCLIYEIDPSKPRGKAQMTGKPLGLGIARCSPKDKYLKETGRKVALHKAIWKRADASPHTEVSPFNRFERQKIWDAYLNRALREQERLATVASQRLLSPGEPLLTRPSQEVADEVV